MIQLLKISDATQFKKLRLETLKTDPKSWLSTFDVEKGFPNSVFSERIKYWSHFPGFGYFGYFDNDDLLAYILISPNSWANKKHIVAMSDFAVAFDQRRKGVGKKLVEGVIEIVKKMQGVEQIQLFVNSYNVGAIAFYEKLGFKRVATIPNSVKNSDGTYQDEYIYIFKI
jgi:ribosomal protein S18 acetylase RimI-like enzyme